MLILILINIRFVFLFVTSIPFIGDLLSNRSTQKNKTELIVFITPRILELNNVEVKNTEKYKEIEKKLLNDNSKKK